MLTYFKAIRPRQGFTVDEPPTSSPHTAQVRGRCPQRKTSFEKVKFSSYIVIVSQCITPRVQSLHANYLHKFSFIHTKMAGCENGEILTFQSSFRRLPSEHSFNVNCKPKPVVKTTTVQYTSCFLNSINRQDSLQTHCQESSPKKILSTIVRR
jgi:hypothetical protein